MVIASMILHFQVLPIYFPDLPHHSQYNKYVFGPLGAYEIYPTARNIFTCNSSCPGSRHSVSDGGPALEPISYI